MPSKSRFSFTICVYNMMVAVATFVSFVFWLFVVDVYKIRSWLGVVFFCFLFGVLFFFRKRGIILQPADFYAAPKIYIFVYPLTFIFLSFVSIVTRNNSPFAGISEVRYSRGTKRKCEFTGILGMWYESKQNSPSFYLSCSLLR